MKSYSNVIMAAFSARNSHYVHATGSLIAKGHIEFNLIQPTLMLLSVLKKNIKIVEPGGIN